MIKKITRNIIEQNDGFERYTQSFPNLKVEDFQDINFPVFCEVHYNFSNYFDWTQYQTYHLIEDEEDISWIGSHGGSGVAGTWVETPEELVEYLSGFEDSNYDDGSHYWEDEYIDLDIEVKELQMKIFICDNYIYDIKVNSPLESQELKKKIERVAEKLEESDIFWECNLDKYDVLAECYRRKIIQ